jgi:tetratricopeptide (TPR) repeat protein
MGLAHSALGDAKAADASLNEMHEAIARTKATTSVLQIAELELKGTLAARAGENRQAWKMLEDASLKEQSLIYQEPPAYPRPVAEGWGSVALAVKDYVEADRAFQTALVVEPGSGRAYLGRSKALAGLEKSAESHDMLQKARVSWNHADVELPETAVLRAASTASID